MHEPAELELFASDEQLRALEARHAAEPQAASVLMALAWALRQREPERSLSLARTAAESNPALNPRLWLMQAERTAALGRLDEADEWQARALAAFEAEADRVGQVDAHYLTVTTSTQRGGVSDLVPLSTRVRDLAEAAAEPLRQAISRLVLARMRIMSAGFVAELSNQALLPPQGAVLHPSVAANLALYKGTVAARRSDPAAVQHFIEAHDLALISGQGRAASLAASSLAFVHDASGDTASALEWSHAALNLARARWPAFESHCLASTATLLRRLGQLQEAREMARECLQREQDYPNSRPSLISLAQLGAIELADDGPARALPLFDQVLAHPAAWPDLRFDVMLDRTEALLRLGRFAEAEAAAQGCMAMDGSVSLGPLLLRARAQLADAWLGLGQAQRAQQAQAAVLADCTQLADFKPLVSMLEAAARAHAAVGLHTEAFALDQRAREAREDRHNHLAAMRSRALYAKFRTERT